MYSSHMQKELWVVSGMDKKEETKKTFGFRVTLKEGRSLDLARLVCLK